MLHVFFLLLYLMYAIKKKRCRASLLVFRLPYLLDTVEKAKC
jgi:hypothetical protein